MITQPGSTLYGILDETAGGWLCDWHSEIISRESEFTEKEENWAIDIYGDPTHTYSVRPFVVPAPGEMG